MSNALAVAAAAMVVACGGSSSTSKSSESSPSPSPSPSKEALLTVPADICTLVTADEASAALGGGTKLTNQAGVNIPGACFYATSDGKTGVFIFAQAYPDSTTADNVSPDQMAAAFRGIYGIADAKPVSGIGKKAFEYTATSASGSPGIAIFVFKANVVLFIIMSPSTDSQAIETMAQTAISHLKSS